MVLGRALSGLLLYVLALCSVAGGVGMGKHEAYQRAILIMESFDFEMMTDEPVLRVAVDEDHCERCQEYIGEMYAGAVDSNLTCKRYPYIAFVEVYTPFSQKVELLPHEAVLCTQEDMDPRDSNQLVIKFYATVFGDASTLNLDPSEGAIDALGQGALHWLANSPHLSPAKLWEVMESGADVNLRDKLGKTFLDVLMESLKRLAERLGIESLDVLKESQKMLAMRRLGIE